MGNAPAFTYTPTVEKLQHFSSLSGVKTQDDEVTTQVGADIAITLDEITAGNLRLALLGSVAAYTQAALTDAEFPITGVEAGKSYDLGKVNLTSVAIDDGATTPVAYVLDTHYQVDLVAGIVRILALPEGAGADCVVTMNAAAITESAGQKVVAMLQDLDMEGGFMCVGKNSKGSRLKVTVGRVSLQPSGAIPFISDEYAQVELSGKAMADTSDSAYPFGRVLELVGGE
ncbi:MAG TPA: hypothetical protein DCW68_02600 [Rhodospirillaceae bacterium]|nr:MAG: hypothetical protein A2018_05575 [Alphaproteobacteria bacterium GWF2_58_20]HAU28984.1 hypothetical protein [Rhodospirillaceae bacterium]